MAFVEFDDEAFGVRFGGFFGAGMGVMMLATLGLTEGGGYHRLNALKNMLSIVIAAVAIREGRDAWRGAACCAPVATAPDVNQCTDDCCPKPAVPTASAD